MTLSAWWSLEGAHDVPGTAGTGSSLSSHTAEGSSSESIFSDERFTVISGRLPAGNLLIFR